MAFLIGSLTSSKHSMTTPAAASRLQVGTQNSLRIVSGVRQGCILSPFLFIIIVMDFVMRRTMDKSEYGIVWQKWNRLTNLDFADDIAIVAEEENVCQERDDYQARGTKCPSWTEYKPGKKRRPWESPSAHHHSQ